jgi:predicted aconitase with swiveling domain
MTRPASEPIPVVVLVPGQARAPAFVLHEPLSFWGGLDVVSGKIIDRSHPQVGKSVGGQILVMEAGRGSSSGSSVLAEAIRLGTGPAGIVLLTRDAIVTVGAMVASELYGKQCPVVMIEQRFWSQIEQAHHLSIAADDERGEITTEPLISSNAKSSLTPDSSRPRS